MPVGVLGIMVFAEMSGRVAAIHKRANFELVRERYSPTLGLITLISSLVLCFLTLAAELGGVGVVLMRFFDALDGNPDRGAVGEGFVPHGESASNYRCFAVGLIAAAFMPYEVYFYSSGAKEEGWTEKDLGINRANAIIGYGLGGLLSVALLVTAAQVFNPHGVDPGNIATVGLGAQIPLGETGLLLALVGILFAVGGAAIDTCFSGAYNLAQDRGWPWGKKKGHRGAPVWTITWVAMFLGGYAVIATGLDPIRLTEYAVLLSVLALPPTYLPILLVARDRELMGEHRNGLVANTLGWAYFALICVLTIAAPALLFATNGGGGG